MKTLTNKVLLDIMLQHAKADARGRNDSTGWCEMGALSCAYYPRSDRHSYFLPSGVISFAEAEQFLRQGLRLTVPRVAA